MIEHTGPISGIAAYGDDFVATAGYDNQVILWDQHTGTSVSRGLHDHLANHCAFDPSGTRLVTSSSDYTARLWSVPDLSLLAVLNEHDDDVEMSVFHPTDDLVATASRDHDLRVYDLQGKLVRQFSGHKADVISVEWASTGDELITSSDDGTVKRWSMSTGGLVEDIDLGGVETDTVVIDPAGVLYAGNDLGEIVVIRSTGTERVTAHQAGIKRLVLAADRQLLISLSYDRMMRLWDISGPTPAQVTETSFPDDVWPRSCAFAAGSTVVCGTFGSTYRTFDYRTGRWAEEDVPVTHGVNAACEFDHSVFTVGDSGQVQRDGTAVVGLGSLCNFLTPLDQIIVTGGQLGRAMDALTGRTLHQHRSPLNGAARFVRDGAEHVIIAAYTGEGIVLRTEGDQLVHVRDVQLHENAVKGVAVSDGVIFSVCADQTVAWHDADTLTELHRVSTAHDRIANGCVALGGGEFASVGRDLRLRLWDAAFTGESLPTPLTHSIKCVSADTTGNVIALGAYDGHVAVYDRTARRWTEHSHPTAAGISAMAFDADHGRFLASSYDGRVYPIPMARS
ncbi:MAG TPA: WD40 repeat domain-containing protein [Pseudonocardiaceae bacterium]|jgi:WD40 repeat protein|nr:WD40 repeat domain-containing protein [Pseudonocardiaceae bacterium]